MNARSEYTPLLVTRSVNEKFESAFVNVPVIAPVAVFNVVPSGKEPAVTEYTVEPIGSRTVVFAVKPNEVPPLNDPRAPASGLFQETNVTSATDVVNARSEWTPLFVARIVKE